LTTLAQKQSAIKAWIRSVSGYGANNVILRNAGGPRPVGAYAVFDAPYKTESVGTAFVSEQAGVDGVLTRVHTRFSVVRSGIDVYSPNGPDILDALEMSRETVSARAALAAGDLTFIRRTAIVPVPEYGDTDPRDRYRADFYFYAQSDLTETDYDLQQMTASVEFVDGNDQTRIGEVSVGEIEE
jgi:hypothetical protein